MAKTPHMYTVTGVVRQIVAAAMSEQTKHNITADMVNYVHGESLMNVYAAQVGDVTVLCWFRQDGQCIVKSVCW